MFGQVIHEFQVRMICGEGNIKRVKSSGRKNVKIHHKSLGIGVPEFSFTCIYVYVSEKAMAPHSSTLAWKIPWTEGPGGLQSMGSLGVGHD